MTIRKTLMIAFLLTSLVPSLILALLAFHVAGNSMRAEIASGLQVEASTVSQDIDRMLFERLQNAQTWSRLEVMQDIQINDVDKRLAKFLSGVKSGYGDVYRELSCADPHGRIVASSDPAAVGRVAEASGSDASAILGGSAIRLAHLRVDANHALDVLPVDVDVRSMFNADRIGKLQLFFNWSQIYRILDQAGRNGRMVIVADHDGRIMAASEALRRKGMLLRYVPTDWLDQRASGTATRDGAFLQLDELTVGSGRSHGFQQFPGSGWTTLVLQPSQLAFVPVRNLAWVFLLLLALTSSLAVAVSLLVAGRIAEPIAALTMFTRAFMRDGQLAPVPKAAAGEVGELTHVFVQTIGELEQSRSELIHASKLAALGELSAIMAHEIRTPIGILCSSAQMLAREDNVSDEGRELIGFVQSETTRLNELVSTLLDSTRTREPTMEPCDIAELIELCVGLLSAQAATQSVVITARPAVAASIIDCDSRQITQVLLNLLQNAIQILPEGGHVEVQCRGVPGGLSIEVQDDGPGISEEALPRVFEPFFTRRDGGIGLGLSVVKQIVRAHGGSIVAGMGRLGGASFTIFLPRHEENR